jgi:hypothetical protein
MESRQGWIDEGRQMIVQGIGHVGGRLWGNEDGSLAKDSELKKPLLWLLILSRHSATSSPPQSCSR